MFYSESISTCLYCNWNLICASVLHLGKSFSLVADDWQRYLPPTSGPGHFFVWLEGKEPQGTKGESFTCKTACSFQFQGEMGTDQWDVKMWNVKNRCFAMEFRTVIYDTWDDQQKNMKFKICNFESAFLHLMYLLVAGQSGAIHFACLRWRWGGWLRFCWYLSCKVSK